MTPLVKAAFDFDVDAVRALLPSASLEEKQEAAEKFIDAAYNTSEECGYQQVVDTLIPMLIQGGVDPNAYYGQDYFLECAAGIGSLNSVRWLLEHGALIDGPLVRRHKGSALSQACFKGNIPMVNHLLDQGADVDIDQGMPLVCAAMGPQAKTLVTLLAEKGASLHRLDEKGEGVLHTLAKFYKGDLSLVEWVIAQGVSPHQANSINETPVSLTRFEVVKTTMEKAWAQYQAQQIESATQNACAPSVRARM